MERPPFARWPDIHNGYLNPPLYRADGEAALGPLADDSRPNAKRCNRTTGLGSLTACDWTLTFLWSHANRQSGDPCNMPPEKLVYQICRYCWFFRRNTACKLIGAELAVLHGQAPYWRT
jgi:hypothetical protein